MAAWSTSGEPVIDDDDGSRDERQHGSAGAEPPSVARDLGSLTRRREGFERVTEFHPGQVAAVGVELHGHGLGTGCFSRSISLLGNG